MWLAVLLTSALGYGRSSVMMDLERALKDALQYKARGTYKLTSDATILASDDQPVFMETAGSSFGDASTLSTFTSDTATAECDGRLSIQVDGDLNDIPGCGLQECDARLDLETSGQCARRCLETEGCKAYTWNEVGGDLVYPDTTVCTLYDSDIPTAVAEGRAFCQIFRDGTTGGTLTTGGTDFISPESIYRNADQKCRGSNALPCGAVCDDTGHYTRYCLNDQTCGTGLIGGRYTRLRECPNQEQDNVRGSLCEADKDCALGLDCKDLEEGGGVCLVGNTVPLPYCVYEVDQGRSNFFGDIDMVFATSTVVTLGDDHIFHFTGACSTNLYGGANCVERGFTAGRNVIFDSDGNPTQGGGCCDRPGEATRIVGQRLIACTDRVPL